MTSQPIGKAVEVMAQEIEDVQKALEKALNGRLSKRALIVLIKDALPHGKKISEKHIEAVLEAMFKLEHYVVAPGTNFKRKVDL